MLELTRTKGFTTKQADFVRAFVSHGDKTRAATDAGYSSDSANMIANTMLRQPAILAAVQIGLAHDLAIGAVKSNRLLQEVVENKTADLRLRVVCARDILNRAGHIAPKAVAQGSTAAKPLNEMSMSELRELADKLEDELSGRAKDVSSATAAPVKPQALEDII
jgi:phage terminase small subunit